MATQALDTFQTASFAGTTFPFVDLTIEGALDHHLHKYIHRPGGELESLARRVYEFRFKVAAHTTYKAFPDLYPTRLGALLAACESGLTYDLEVPGFGTIQAKGTKWTRNIRAAVRSGESVDFSFMEDGAQLFTALALLGVSASTISDKAIRFATTAQALGVPSATIVKITSTVDGVMNIVNQTDDATATLSIQMSPVLALCGALDNTSAYKDPNNTDSIDALHDLWAAAAAIDADALNKSQPIESFIVERQMSVSEASIAIYDDALHVSELLRLNALSDAMRIPPGTFLRHYAIG